MASVPVQLRYRYLTHLGAIAIYFALTIAITWPLAINFTRVPADLADPVLSIWLLWWNATVLPLSETWWNGLPFFPATDTVTLSDHRLGLGIITTPIILGGVSPVIAYNIAFVASFVLSAAAAYGLGFALTGSPLAAFIGGLIFGFNPFRAGHLEHLELLAAYWLPVMLLSLHRWLNSGAWRWLLAFVVAAVMQALTSGYYFVFSMVLIGLWALWFMLRRDRLRSIVPLAGAVMAPMIAVAPILYHYQQAHERMGLRRGITEIESLSADLSGLLTAPERLVLWNSPAAWQRLEGAVLPGLLAVAIVIFAVTVDLRRRVFVAAPILNRVRAVAAVLAAIVGFAALIPSFFGPVDFSLGPVRISISDSFKPLTLTIVFLVLLMLTSSGVRAWIRERSLLGFYALATLAMWVLALGPTARLFGEPVFYKAPYSWLMLLPGFSDAFRAPARFALLAALTLSAAGALAFHRLFRHARPGPRVFAGLCLAIGVILESWTVPLAVHDAPSPLEIPQGVPAGAAIMEWPPGIYEDAAAMYRSIAHRRHLVNGLSGYQPPHYGALVAALADGKVDAMLPLASSRDIALFLLKSDPETPTDAAALTAETMAARIGESATHVVLLLPQRAVEPSQGMALANRRDVALSSDLNAAALRYMLDDDYSTAWGTASGQSGTEHFVADLGSPAQVRGVVLASGDRITLFGREVAIDVSLDRTNWTESWRGSFAAPSVAAAIARPARMDVSIEFQPALARYIRVRQLGRSQEPWAVAELGIVTAR